MDIKLVDFDLFCGKCKWEKEEENGPHCYECLEVGGREGSHIPVRFEEADK